jgi:hypothetical protein
MILHMSLHWPGQANLELWHFTLEHAAYLWNHLMSFISASVINHDITKVMGQ